MSEKRSFIPYQGKEETISNHPFKEGSIYFATDTGRMYLDTVSNGRISVGGGASGISFYYSLDNGIEIKTEDCPRAGVDSNLSIELQKEGIKHEN